MCGFAGVLDAHTSVDQTLLDALCAELRPRGPDGSGTWLADGVGMAATRLSIVDPSAGANQPLASPDDGYRLMFNGEIYNHEDLRRRLEGKGHRFGSRCDTEVVLAALVEWGDGAFERFEGMFALCFHDVRARRTVLARDRFGIKPLFVGSTGRGVAFGSTIAAVILAGVPARVDASAGPELFTYRSVGGTATPWVGIERVEPGGIVEVSVGSDAVTIDRRRWHDQLAATTPTDARSGEVAARTESALLAATDRRSAADRRVGVLLSGGVDSSLVASMLPRAPDAGLTAYTVGFDPAHEGYDESALAAAVAERCGLDHHLLRVADGDLYDLTRRATRALGEPLVHANEPHLLALAELASAKTSVLLGGEGADELFGGYARHRALGLRIPSAIRSAIGTVAKLSPGAGPTSRAASLAGTTDAATRLVAGAADAAGGRSCMVSGAHGGNNWRRDIAEHIVGSGRTPLAQALIFDRLTYLPSLLDRLDAMTMAAGVEARVPFLDDGVVAAADLAMDARYGDPGALRNKAVLRSIAERRTAGPTQRKWGFGVPWHRHLRSIEPFAEIVRRLGHHDVCELAGVDPGAVATVSAEFLAGNDRETLTIRRLTFMAIWLDEGRSAEIVDR